MANCEHNINLNNPFRVNIELRYGNTVDGIRLVFFTDDQETPMDFTGWTFSTDFFDIEVELPNVLILSKSAEGMEVTLRDYNLDIKGTLNGVEKTIVAGKYEVKKDYLTSGCVQDGSTINLQYFNVIERIVIDPNAVLTLTGEFVNNTDPKHPKIEGINLALSDKVDYSDIVNDLTTGGAEKVLSAEMGLKLNTDVVNLKTLNRRIDTNSFAANNTTISTSYKPGAIIAFGNVGYVDDGSALYLNIIQGKRPIIQIINASDTIIAQYFDNRVDFIETGIKVVDIKKYELPTVYFRCIINWDIVNGETWNLGKTLQINPKINYLNDIRSYVNDQITLVNTSVDEDIAELNAQVDYKLSEKPDKIDIWERTENLFDVNDPDVVFGKWIPSTSTTGNLETLSIIGLFTGFIPVKEGDVIHTRLTDPSSNMPGYYAIFDENKQIITQASQIFPPVEDGYRYTVKAGEKFVRIAFNKSKVPDLAMAQKVTVIVNKLVPTYIPFGYKAKLDLKKNQLPNTRFGKTIVCCGDSITEFGNYPETIESLTGAKTYNIGIGGTRMAKHPTADYDKFSMYRLADAIATGDWSLQIAAAANLGGIYPGIAARMASIDFATVDIITMFFGTNDFTGNNPIGTNADNTGTTIKGALNYAINTILTALPKIQIVCITPIYRNVSGVSSDTFTNTNGDKLIDIVNAEEEICELQHIEYLSMYNTAGINSKTITTYLADGTHPTQLGYDLLGRKIATFLNTH